MKNRIIITFIMIISILVLTFSTYAEEGSDESITSAKGKVLEVLSEPNSVDKQTLGISTQVVKVKILNGKYKDKEFIIENNLSGNPAFDINVKKGDDVLLGIEETPGEAVLIYITDFVRDKYIFMLILIFIFLLVLIGGIKGVKSVITLSITAFIILGFMLPLILKGFNPIWVTILSATIITVITFFVIAGINIKSISAIVGTVGGVVFAGVLAYIVGSLVKLTGLSSEEASMLMYIPQQTTFDYRGLLFSGIIIGTLGAVMDIGMSISSAMYELRTIHPDITPKELYKSGLNIGKDVMGTMSNTLILAYTGSSLQLLLLFLAYETSLLDIINLDLIATEFVRALVGSIGLIIAIPITALSTGLILKYKN